MLKTVAGIDGVLDFYSEEALGGMDAGCLPMRSFGPMVWFASAMMATEVIKVLLGREPIARAPRWALYDPYHHLVPEEVVA